MSTRLPQWLDTQWAQVLQALEQGRLPHALLVVGPKGVGKRLLAEQLAGLLLCEDSSGRSLACGQCGACGWMRAGTHPDLLQVLPEDTGKAIKVDQIRRLNVELNMTSHAGLYKVAIIEPADAMNVNAANSLLKTLEEPTANTLLLLLTDSPGKLPKTIVSRCQRLVISPPSLQVAMPWLEAEGLVSDELSRLWTVAGGAPLRIRSLVESDQLSLRDHCLDELLAIFAGRTDPLKAAQAWAGDGAQMAQVLQWWSTWLQDCIRWQQSGRAPDDAELVQKLQRIVETVDCKALFGLSDRIYKVLNALGSGLNAQMQLEDLLIDWACSSGKSNQRAKTAER